eukprot:12567533-Alexandrium_andersonii.AAC.1
MNAFADPAFGDDLRARADWALRAGRQSDFVRLPLATSRAGAGVDLFVGHADESALATGWFRRRSKRSRRRRVPRCACLVSAAGHEMTRGPAQRSPCS